MFLLYVLTAVIQVIKSPKNLDEAKNLYIRNQTIVSFVCRWN